MEKILKGLISRICFVYLDDVIIYGKIFEEMILENLRGVFLRLQESGLRINPKKCVFLGKETRYLDHVVSSHGIATDADKTLVVDSWPIPKTRKQVRRCLGFFCSYYRRFVKGFSLIAKTLYKLTEESTPFSWTYECQRAFQQLKQVLVAPPILSFPTTEGRFILDTDASNHGIGAVLSQQQGEEEKVIAYFSCVFSKVERNYCVTRQELLAVVDAVKSFHHYLYGRKFSVRTDHISLRWLLSFRNLEGQLARWLERLQQYDFDVVYRSGKAHGNADGLSRRPCSKDDCHYCTKVEAREKDFAKRNVARILAQGSSETWRVGQLQDQEISMFLQAKEAGLERPGWQEVAPQGKTPKIYWSQWDALEVHDGVLYKKWMSPDLKKEVLQIIVLRAGVVEILREAYDSPTGGHFEVNRTLP